MHVNVFGSPLSADENYGLLKAVEKKRQLVQLGLKESSAHFRLEFHEGGGQKKEGKYGFVGVESWYYFYIVIKKSPSFTHLGRCDLNFATAMLFSCGGS